VPESQEHPIIRRGPALPRRRGDDCEPPRPHVGETPAPAPAPKPERRLRPEIQALRAIAVTLVVVSHLWPAALPGGFVGVDVFFAISGFLITSLLLREIDRTGRISLASFWARRARRILPAALLTLLFVAIATVAFVPLNLWQQYFADLRASTGYFQNWHLASTAVDYFHASDAPSPVQHFWSLAVEEQFYLVWPVLMLLGLAGAPSRHKKAAIAAGMALLTLASLVYSIRYTPADPNAAYFITPTRAWEFGLGGLLALLPGFERSPSPARAALSWIGLIAIGLAAALYSPATQFPGYAAALPVLGAVAVMRAGAPAGRLAPTGLMSLRPVQLLGDISYSVYLWHWPLIVLTPFVIAGGLTTTTKVGIIMLTVIAAWLSKVFVEDPVRRSGFLSRRPLRWTFALALAGTAAMLAVTFGGTSQVRAEITKQAKQTNAFLAKAPTCFGAAARDTAHPCSSASLAKKVVPTPAEARERPNAPCTVTEKTGTVQVCAFGASPPKATATVALVGDSHASHWRAALAPIAVKSGWRGLSLTHTSCPFSRAQRKLPEPINSHCLRWKGELVKWFAKHPEVSTVFVSQLSGGSGVVTHGKSAFETEVAGYIAAWKSLPATVKHIVVIRDNPNVGGHTDVCVQQAIAKHRNAGQACALSRSKSLNADAAATAARRLDSPRVQVIDLTPFMCSSSQCFPVVGGALVYKDATHLTAVFAKTLSPYLGRALGRLEASWS
jgi:peptidoglycan/LPS O-acetylase OafA/YrhL